MPFQLEEVTQITVTNANPRREFHGEEKVRAIDLAFKLTGENTLLDMIEQGLREHHYWNKALTAGQEPLPGVLVPLPNLRFPNLPLSYAYTYPAGKKLRGYRFVRDYGTDDERWDFTDVVLANLHYDIAEGGSVTVYGTIQYNGDELADNDLYGALSGLASEGDIHIRLIAPPELVAAKKGYRAGKPDTAAPKADDGQGEIDEIEEEEEEEEELDPSTPEGALAGSAAAIH